MSSRVVNSESQSPLLTVKGLSVNFSVSSRRGWRKKKTLHAVRDVSFDVFKGTTFGIVGESGCGKSTLGRSLLGLVPSSCKELTFDGLQIQYGKASKAIRRRMAMIFQDPISSLNPCMNLRGIIEEPLRIFEPQMSRKERNQKMCEMLERVGLPSSYMDRRPDTLSGGQCQRVGIARAMIMRPDLVICDEPTSALDVSVQAQILNLLKDLQGDFGTAYVFISHDLSVIHHMCHDVMVLYLGQVVEQGATDAVCRHPLHPYTKMLMSSFLTIDDTQTKTSWAALPKGEVPSPFSLPQGCAFQTRCSEAQSQCSQPPSLHMQDGRKAACHFVFSPRDMS